MPIGYKDRTDQFGRIIDTAAERARQDTALAEEGVSRGMIGSIQAVGQIPANILAGYQKGRQFAEESAERQSKIQGASEESKIRQAEYESKIAQKKSEEDFLAREFQPGMTRKQAAFDLPLREKMAQTDIAKKRADADLISARNKGQYEQEVLAIKKAAAEGPAKERAPGGPQYLAAGFGKRLEQSNKILENLEQEGYKPQAAMAGIRRAVPEVLGGNYLRTSQDQQQEQAERNFINAVLRRESGAAISPEEFESGIKQYFPRAGDSEQVLAQKKASREGAIQNLKAEARLAWEDIPTQEIATVKKPQGKSGTAYAAPVTTHSDDEARSWAESHPNDRRALEILQRLGVQ